MVFHIVKNAAHRALIEGNVSPHWLRHSHASIVLIEVRLFICCKKRWGIVRWRLLKCIFTLGQLIVVDCICRMMMSKVNVLGVIFLKEIVGMRRTLEKNQRVNRGAILSHRPGADQFSPLVRRKPSPLRNSSLIRDKILSVSFPLLA